MHRQPRCNIGPLPDSAGPFKQSQLLCETGSGTCECTGFEWSMKVQDRVKMMVEEVHGVSD